MKHTVTRVAAAALLAACALGASAQTPPPPAAPGAPQPGMHMHDPALMQQHMLERQQKRMDRLKRILQITPQQEGAWQAWTTAMRPAMRPHMNRDEFARMTTPERIDRLKQMRAERNAAQDRRGDATKTLYAQLTAPQQKAFDEVSAKFLSPRGGKRGGGDMPMRHHGRWNS